MRANSFGLHQYWLAAVTAIGALAFSAAAEKQPAAKADPGPSGRELFTREWLPNDSRAHGGDGLGPDYNESSCVACHNQGGIGGGGPAGHNVDIITALPNPALFLDVTIEPAPASADIFDSLFGALAPRPKQPRVPIVAHAATADEKKSAKQREKEALVKVHPGFASARSVVLHRFSTDPKYPDWREGILAGQHPAPSRFQSPGGMSEQDSSPFVGLNIRRFQDPRAEIARFLMEVEKNGGNNTTRQVGLLLVSRSQRNPIALFGVGQIDAIPEEAILEVARAERHRYHNIAGRPSMQKNGTIGRFGWKAQKASLDDFALTSCAVELGLNVPGHEQGGSALQPDYKAPGLDMNQAECDALVAFLRDLPAPVQRIPASAKEAAAVEAGHKQFAAIGCAACHVQKLGNVDGIYSDLLLHDMGSESGDTGSYSVFTPKSQDEQQKEPPSVADGDNPSNDPFAGRQSPEMMTSQQLDKVVGALGQEWRTPPLWGVRDSGPYMHDGRADTLEQAIALHDGQGREAAQKLFALNPEERQQVLAFLKSLCAPEAIAAVK